MMKQFPSFPIDNSSILFFSLLRPTHSNSYRFSAVFSEPVCPETLEKALARVSPRFPSIFVSFQPGFFQYTTVPLRQPPKAAPDPGVLHTMTLEEMKESAIRVYYTGCELSIELFHAVADGNGAIQAFRTLIAEYLFQKYGTASPEKTQMLEEKPDLQEELRDAYLDHAREKAGSIPNHYAYQLPGKDRDWMVKYTSRAFPTQALLQASRAYSVSMTVFLSALMAEAIMDIQDREQPKKLRPVRIMVPVDLRRLFPNKTLRNYVLYGLPTLEPREATLPRQERMLRFREQLKHQSSAQYLLPQVARNVRIQLSPLYRCIPRVLKCGIMRIAYDFFGEPNSSITLTNLGPFPLSPALAGHVRAIDLTMTPRRRSPYNCSVISCGDTTRINICRFCAKPDLENIFFQKLQNCMEPQPR